MIRFLKPSFLLCIILMAGSMFMSATTHAQSSTPADFEPAPCPFDGTKFVWIEIAPEDSGFECGYVTVPERHANPAGPTIRLPIAILHATGSNPAPDPLFVTQGGPGGSAFDVYSLIVPTSAIPRSRDIVIINQRGTQFAEPELICTEIIEGTGALLEETDAASAEALENSQLSACRDRLLSQGIDLSAYNSLENAADIAAISQALGYDSYNFYGVSYGTLLGLHLMANHPEGLRSVILDGVVPPNLNFIPEVPKTESRAYTELFALCQADPVCAADYPNLQARTFALIEKLDANPVSLTLTDPETGASYNAILDGSTLRGILFQLFYLDDAYAIFPRAIAEMEQDNFQLLESIWPLFAFDRTMSIGMYQSVICAEDADFDPLAVDLNGVLPELNDGSAITDLESYLESCALWGVDELPGSVDNATVSDIPTLLMSGQYDPITPPSNAALAAATLPNSIQIVDPTGSHGIAFIDPCVTSIMDAFLANPDTTPDTDCLAELEQSPVVPADALTLPMLTDFGSLNEQYFNETAVAGLFLLGLMSAFLVWFVVLMIRVLRKQDIPLTPGQIRLRRIGQILVLLFVVVTFILIAGMGRAMYDSILVNTAFTYANAIDGSSWFVFVLPWILIGIAVALLITTIQIWREENWPIYSKIYFTFLTICAIGYVIILTVHGTTTVLLHS